MWDGFNKRKFPRLDLRCELTLKNQQSGAEVLRTHTQNVGAGGLCIHLDHPLERFSMVSLRLELDPDLPWVECLGKVVWSVPSQEAATQKHYFDTGIEFAGLEAAHQDLIRRYVESRVEAEGKVG